MILLDTNILIYASDEQSKFCRWARRTIAEGVADEGAAINAICLAELCVGDAEPTSVADRVRRWGVNILDVPESAAVICARAYILYRKRRKSESGKEAPITPLPNFFIGAHATVLGCALATADEGRFKKYFPSVRLKMPR